MNIELLKRNYVPIDSVRIGDCFLYGNNLYMKTDGTDCDTLTEVSCICLNNGCVSAFQKGISVEVVNIEIREVGSKK